MNTIEKFKKKFAVRVEKHPRSAGESLGYYGYAKGEHYKLIRQMLRFAGFDEVVIKILIYGKKFSYVYKGKKTSYRMGGIDALYAGSAVWTAYQTVLFFLETGWWLMGLDKAQLVVPNTISYIQPKPDDSEYSRQYKAHFYKLDTIVVFTTGDEYPEWHYTGLALRFEAIAAFLNAFNSQMDFEGIKMAFDDAEMIGNGFSAVDPAQLIKRFS